MHCPFCAFLQTVPTVVEVEDIRAIQVEVGDPREARCEKRKQRNVDARKARES